jgi:hypothetical protein
VSVKWDPDRGQNEEACPSSDDGKELTTESLLAAKQSPSGVFRFEDGEAGRAATVACVRACVRSKEPAIIETDDNRGKGKRDEPAEVTVATFFGRTASRQRLTRR